MINVYTTSVEYKSEDLIKNIHKIAQEYGQYRPKRNDTLMHITSAIENMLRYYYSNNIIKEYSCVLYKKEQSFSSSRRDIGNDHFFYITFLFFDNENHEFTLDIE